MLTIYLLTGQPLPSTVKSILMLPHSELFKHSHHLCLYSGMYSTKGELLPQVRTAISKQIHTPADWPTVAEYRKVNLDVASSCLWPTRSPLWIPL